MHTHIVVVVVAAVIAACEQNKKTIELSLVA
jgi:hypothetical protein